MKKMTKVQRIALITSLYRLYIENGLQHNDAAKRVLESISPYIGRGTMGAVLLAYRRNIQEI